MKICADERHLRMETNYREFMAKALPLLAEAQNDPLVVRGSCVACGERVSYRKSPEEVAAGFKRKVDQAVSEDVVFTQAVEAEREAQASLLAAVIEVARPALPLLCGPWTLRGREFQAIQLAKWGAHAIYLLADGSLEESTVLETEVTNPEEIAKTWMKDACLTLVLAIDHALREQLKGNKGKRAFRASVEAQRINNLVDALKVGG